MQPAPEPRMHPGKSSPPASRLTPPSGSVKAVPLVLTSAVPQSALPQDGAPGAFPLPRRRCVPDPAVTRPPPPVLGPSPQGTARGAWGCSCASWCLCPSRLQDEAAGCRTLAGGASRRCLLLARVGARQLL